MTIIAAADGSALGNPGPAGWAWFIDETSYKIYPACRFTNAASDMFYDLLAREWRLRR